MASSSNGNGYDGKKGLQIKENRSVAFKVSGACTVTITFGINGERVMQLGTDISTNKQAYGYSKTSPAVFEVNSAGVVYITASSDLYMTKLEITFPSEDTPVISASSASITATESGVETTEDITVTGANLTGSTLTATLSPAVAGLSVTLGSSTITDGAISTTATLHYTQTENASGSTTLTLSDGTTLKEVTVNYKAKVVATELVAVSEAVSFNLKEVGTSGLDAVTVDDGYVVLADAGSEVSFADNLAVAGIAGAAVTWRGDAVQGPLFKFKTTVPGKVTVEFSDVGSSGTRKNRYANVNGVRTDVYSTTSASEGVVKCSPIEVNAGDIIIKGQVDNGDETFTDNQIRVFTITFTPVTSVSKTITAAGWATYCSPYALDFSGSIANLTKAYIVTGATGSTLSLADITGTIPANTGILLEGEGEVVIPVVASSSTSVSGNKLVGVTSNTSIEANAGYVLMNETAGVGFYKNAYAFTVGANTAYLPANFAAGAARSAYFFGGVTGVENVEAAAEAEAQDGKFIENGKLVIVKNGQKYNAAGAKLY